MVIDLQSAAVLLDVVLLGLCGSGVRYLVSIEKRLTRIETIMNLG